MSCCGALLVKQLADRQIRAGARGRRVSDPAHRAIVRGGASLVVHALDRASLRARRPITMPLARAVLDELGAERAAEEERLMDLGIRGRRAIVCAASKGLGRACAEALAENGVALVINARGREALEATAAEIRAAHGVEVTAVAADVATEAGRAALLAACPDPDILVNNAGGPPPGDFRDWGEEAWLAALRANMLAPIALIRAVVDGMAARRLRPDRQHHLGAR